ncbi:MAG: 50S ribosomal protein L11 methyltransferase [Bdellovibrionia bacterium]
MSYFCLRIRGLTDNEVDLITDLCFGAGATGIEEALAFSQPNLEYEAQVVKAKTHDVIVYFDERPSEIAHDLQSRFPKCEISLSKEAERDWLAEWKKGFQPFCLAGPYWVVPSWLPIPKDATRPLKIDPGMAFGTGTHATTQLCARYLASAVKPGQSVLDVGTGTAILAMVAHFQGATGVVGIDVDPEARRVARENLKLNEISAIEIPDNSLSDISAKFDVVVANIIDGVLLKLRSELIRVLKPGGLLILGGVLLEREDDFLEPFLADTGFKLLARAVQDDWVSYELKLL